MHQVRCVLAEPGCVRPSEFALVFSFIFNVPVLLSLLKLKEGSTSQLP